MGSPRAVGPRRTVAKRSADAFRFGDVTRSLLLSDPTSAADIRALFAASGEEDLYEEFVLLSAEELLSRYIESDRLRGFMMFMGMVSTWGGRAA